MINKELVSDFADIIGNMEIAINLDSLKEAKSTYEIVLKELLEWIKSYYINKNFNVVTYEKSLEIHELLDSMKWKIITNQQIGEEALLTDNILIRYEVIMKTISNEREKI